jgi:hypothetical protein
MSEPLSIQRDVIAQQLLPKLGESLTPPVGTHPQIKRPERSPDDAPEFVKEIHSLKARISATTRWLALTHPRASSRTTVRGLSGAKRIAPHQAARHIIQLSKDSKNNSRPLRNQTV